MPSSTSATRPTQPTIAGLVAPVGPVPVPVAASAAAAGAAGTPVSLLDRASLRQLFRQTLDIGTTVPPWARSLGWQALLQTLPEDKAQWPAALAQHRAQYYQLVRDVLPLANTAPPAASGAPGEPLSERDAILNSMFNDIQALRNKGELIVHAPIPPSDSNPLSPPPPDLHSSTKPRLAERWILLDRLAKINPDFRAALEPVQLDPDTPAQQVGQERYGDVWWHALMRILYIFSCLNPSIGHVQGMQSVALVFLTVFSQETGSDHDPPPVEVTELGLAEHVEADAFWCFSKLMSEVQELFDFDGIDRAAAGLHISNTRDEGPGTAKTHQGMAGVLRQLSVELHWVDSDLWAQLHALHLDPQLPTYALRWLVGLLTAELAPLRVAALWDHLLTETGRRDPTSIDGMSKIDFAVDASCAMLVALHDPLFRAAHPRPDDDGQRKSPYARAMGLLLRYPSNIKVGTVLSLAQSYRQRRLTSSLTGDGPSPEEMPGTSKKDRPTLLSSLSLGPSAWLGSSSHHDTSTESSSSDQETLSSPLGGSLSHYAQQLSRSDTVTQVSRQGTVWAAKALKSWTQATSSAASAMTRTKTPTTVAADHFELGSDDAHAPAARVTRNGTVKPGRSSDRSPSSTPIGSPLSLASEPLLDGPRVHHAARRSMILADRSAASPVSHHADRLHHHQAGGKRGSATTSAPASDDALMPSAIETIAAVWNKHRSTPSSTTHAPPKPLMLASHPATEQHHSRRPSAGTSTSGRRSLGTPTRHARAESASTTGSYTALRGRRDSLGSTVTSSSRASDRRIRRGVVGYVAGTTTTTDRSAPASNASPASTPARRAAPLAGSRPAQAAASSNSSSTTPPPLLVRAQAASYTRSPLTARDPTAPSLPLQRFMMEGSAVTTVEADSAPGRAGYGV